MRTCIDCGKVTNGNRCPTCTSTRNAPRLAYKRERYGREYRQVRAMWERMDVTETGCARCGKPIGAGPWDLDHSPLGLWPAHPKCNRSAG